MPVQVVATVAVGLVVVTIAAMVPVVATTELVVEKEAEVATLVA